MDTQFELVSDEVTGEQTLRFGSEEVYVFMPSWKAIRYIENQLGMGLRPIFERLIGDFNVTALAVCACAFNTDGGNKNKARDADFFGELIIKHGFIPFLKPISNILNGTLGKGATKEEAGKDGSNKS